MLRWMTLVADEREGAFSTWPWERVRCACSSSPTARFLCGRATTASLTSTRRVRCQLSLRFDGRVRTWDYPEDSTQFEGLTVGAPIPVLVDPTDSSIVYTLRDVEHRTNAGTSPVFWYGVVLVVLGLAGFAFLLRLSRSTMPRPRWPNRSTA
jgi:hypothetical protein